MRRQESNSCLLRPRASLNGSERKGSSGELSPLSVTVINTQPMASYSAERFYLLGEIEDKAHSTLFLSDYGCDVTDDTAAMSEEDEGDNTSSPFAPYTILYLLWASTEEHCYRNPESYVKGIVTSSVKQFQELTEQQTPTRPHKIYLMIDTLIPEAEQKQEREMEEQLHQHHCVFTTSPSFRDDDDNDDDNDDEEENLTSYQSRVKVAEKLARLVAKDPFLRRVLEGVSVGVSDHVRAAPGLELCTDAVLWGQVDRRRHGKPKSWIGIVGPQPQDLLGLQGEYQETDAAQGVLQSMVCAEWNGNGNLPSFAKRAHHHWCQHNNVMQPSPRRSSSLSSRRKSSTDAAAAAAEDAPLADPITMAMMMAFVAWLYIQLSLARAGENTY